MAAPYAEVDVELGDGRRLTLRRSFRAIAEAEIAAGVNAKEMVETMVSGGPSLKYSACFLFGMLRAHHGDLNLDDAFAIFESDGAAISTAMQQVGDATAAPDRPGKAGSAANPPKAARAGTGTPSSPRGRKKG